MKIYAAKFVLPIAAPQIEDGAIAVDGAKIIGVGNRVAIESGFPEAQVENFGEAAILPGFVNCHTHLELTALRGFLEDVEDNFFAWLRKLTLARMEQMNAEDLYVSSAWGAIEAARAGVTCVGDASDAGAASVEALRAVGLRGVVFQEIFGPDARAADEQLAKLKEKVARLRERETDLVSVGISPHAPYTVSASLIEKTTRFALDENLSLMMHAAESRAETAFMREGAGAFAEGLQRRNIEWIAPRVSTIQYLDALGFLDARPLLAHCVTVDDADIALMKRKRVRVAHCPKSNAKFGHERAPLAKFLTHDLTVGLGSDSVASNNNNDMLEEARFAALASRASGETIDEKLTNAGSFHARETHFASRMINAADILRLTTQGGARSLGMSGKIGALEVGMQADFVVVNLSGAHQMPVYDAENALVFASSGRDVRLTVIGGREVYRDGQMLTIDENELRAKLKELARKLKSA
jgi:cytosine/adenosine deaminase-related metal-dependent hydrolase